MTDTTLAERLARCVKPLEWHPVAKGWMRADSFGCEYHAEEGGDTSRAEEGHRARILAALDMDALAQEVEAIVGAEREACAVIADDEDEALPGWGEHRNAVVADQVKRDIAAAIRAREGGKP
jgi:hypothetical protein